MARYPAANGGAAVIDVEHSIAADGPMTAAALSALSVPALLVSNDVGEDADGVRVHAWLRRHCAATPAGMGAGGERHA